METPTEYTVDDVPAPFDLSDCQPLIYWNEREQYHKDAHQTGIQTKWDEVVVALAVAYQMYHGSKEGFSRAIDRLMQAYDEWLG